MRKILIFNDNQRTRNITQPYHVDIRVAVTGREVGTVVTCMSQCVCGWGGGGGGGKILASDNVFVRGIHGSSIHVYSSL